MTMIYLLFIFIKLSIGEAFIFWTIVAVLVVLYKKYKNRSKQLKIRSSRQNFLVNNISNELIVVDKNRETEEPKESPNIEPKENKELFLYINGGDKLWKWIGLTNPRMCELFEWIDNAQDETLTLHYKSLWYKGMNIAPEIESHMGNNFFIGKDKSVASFRSNLCGYAPIKAPKDGIVKILVEYGTILSKKQTIPDNTDILIIDYKNSLIQKYNEAKAIDAIAKIERENQREKESIKQKILEKQRRRDLEKAVTQELIDDGILFPETKRREPIPREIVDALWNRDRGMCVYCGSKENIHIDHIIPFSKGGSNDIANLQLLCQKCNLEKSNKIG